MKALLLIIIITLSGINLAQTSYPIINKVVFGKITINQVEYEKDVFIIKDTIKKRSKKPSKHLRSKYGHTPLSHFETIPWNCDILVIGSGISDKLPITKQVKKQAKEHHVKLIILKTKEAIKYYNEIDKQKQKVNAVFHITC